MALKQSGMGKWHFLAAVSFVLVIVIGIMLIYPARVRYNRQRELYEKIRAEADQKRAERDALQKEVADLKSNPAAIERVARTKYRLCKEGEIILYYNTPKKNNVGKE